MSKEAMKLALEALEQIKRLTGARWALENNYAGHLEAITDLRKALAEQPAQQALDRMAENARELGLDYEPEPALLRDAVVANLVREGINKHRARELADHFIGLAALQPAQRTWIGLSDEEKRQLFEREDYQGWLDYINAIEAKLKEKNT